MSKLSLILDSTQINAFDECPRLWYYEHVRRLRLASSKPRRRVMDIGSYGHKLLELYYQAIASGKSRSDSLAYCFAYKPEDICDCGHVRHIHKPTTLDPLLTDGNNCKYKNCKCEAFTEVEALVSKKDEEFLRQRLVEYFTVYINNDIRPYSPEHVEVGFSYKLDERIDRLYVLEGKIDILGVYATFPSFTDHKFQERRKELYDKSIQFKNYALVTGCRNAFINYIRLAKETGTDTFVRRTIFFTEPEIALWRKRLIAIYDHVFDLMVQNEKDPFFWQSEESQPRWSRCSGKFGYTCDYTTLCEELSPTVAERKIEHLYTIGKIWRPW